MAAGGRALHVTADLSIEVDGAPVRIEGTGAQVRIVADDVRGLVDRLREAARATGAAPARADVARFADTLADGGLTAVLDAPGGRVATFGAGVDSPVGAVLWGSRRVALDPVGVLRAGDAARWAGVALAVAVLVAVVRSVRRRG